MQPGVSDRELSYARQQQILAEIGEAVGQCECGSYRLDGKPPVLHQPGCGHADDWRADPLYVLRPIVDASARERDLLDTLKAAIPHGWQWTHHGHNRYRCRVPHQDHYSGAAWWYVVIDPGTGRWVHTHLYEDQRWAGLGEMRSTPSRNSNGS